MAGRHSAALSSERGLALSILAVGTLVAAASMLGGVWIVRVGVVIAIVMAISAAWVTTRELNRERSEHRAEMKRQIERRIAQADQHHEESLAMVERYDARLANLQSLLDKQRKQLTAATAELSTMRGNAAWLRGEIAERQARIDSLEARLAAMPEVPAVEPAAEERNVVAMPRHATLSPKVEDLWEAGEHPTVGDISKVQLDIALQQVPSAKVG